MHKTRKEIKETKNKISVIEDKLSKTKEVFSIPKLNFIDKKFEDKVAKLTFKPIWDDGKFGIIELFAEILNNSNATIKKLTPIKSKSILNDNCGFIYPGDKLAKITFILTNQIEFRIKVTVSEPTSLRIKGNHQFDPFIIDIPKVDVSPDYY